ncbi:MAG: alpha/beta fold hydrolase [Nitriliruptoraceae bacterium]
MLRWLLLRVYRIPSAPSKPTPADLGLMAEEVTLRAPDGGRLHAWFLPADGATSSAPGPAVVVVHGWGSAAADLLPAAPALLAAGLSALFIDARGHGGSDPVDFMSMPRFAEDTAAGVAWLHADPRVDAGRVGIVGHSVGAGASLLAAARDPRIAAVVAIAAMAHPAELIRRSKGLAPAPRRFADRVLTTIEHTIGHPFDSFAPVSTIGQVTGKVLVVHGLADTTVPVRDAARLVDAAGGRATLRLVPGAGHRSVEPFLPLVPEFAAYLAAALSSAPAEPSPPVSLIATRESPGDG